MDEDKFLLKIVFSDGLPFDLEIFGSDRKDQMFHLALALKQTDHVKSVELVRKSTQCEEVRI
jgi:hypothetical protein